MPIPNKQCETCNKSTLSLLLLRPSPIAKRGALVPPGSAAVASDEIAMAGLLPERLPTESRFALRLLRDGYVHVYIASPPPGVKNWLVYRVTDTADLVPDWHPSFKKPVACKDDKHNQAGMKLLNIPQAHKINELWIAYSANLWNATLRAKNQANSKAMKHVSLDGRSANTFQPTTENLKSKVLECALGKLSVNGAIDHEFPFHSMAQRVEDLADNLKKAAACHPKTKGKELAVVLSDPVGIASELNALRLRRHELVKDELAKPEIAHPFKSSNALMGLKKIMLDANHLKSYETVSPVMNRGEFENVMRVKPNPRDWPADTRWEPIEPTRENIARFGS
ncbi:MAG: hypothetical protein JWM42_3607, partial [Burkholderia sp.]|nr:hypothetical protein [Burkholderia sp.]